MRAIVIYQTCCCYSYDKPVTPVPPPITDNLEKS
ncbi:hypothetical protein SPLC1_S361240 [Arthrospira platensis C1]|nr:hypothetical protein SPLC1_S361240 [Arthrospira platensis C1]